MEHPHASSPLHHLLPVPRRAALTARAADGLVVCGRGLGSKTIAMPVLPVVMDSQVSMAARVAKAVTDGVLGFAWMARLGDSQVRGACRRCKCRVH